MFLNNRHLSTIALLIIVIIPGCSKFEDGPAISLRTVNQRLDQSWKVEYLLNNSTGVTHSAEYQGWLLTFNKGGSFTYKIIYNFIETNYSGKWEIIGKNQLKLEYGSSNNQIIDFYTIIRLTKKELWLRNELQETHYYSE